MLITRTSPLSGKTHTLEIPVTQEQLDEYQQGSDLRSALPLLNADQREFIKTGITGEEWEALFRKED